MSIIESADLLEQAEKKFGFVPNVFKNMATMPQVLQVYLNGMGVMDQAGLTEQELQAIYLAISAYHECSYCTASHSLLAKHTGIEPEEIQLIAEGKLPRKKRLRILITTARWLLDNNGSCSPEELQAMESKGVTREQLYTIITLIGLKLISNYINKIDNTEIDSLFQDYSL